jgi:hypothetical protein
MKPGGHPSAWLLKQEEACPMHNAPIDVLFPEFARHPFTPHHLTLFLIIAAALVSTATYAAAVSLLK